MTLDLHEIQLDHVGSYWMDGDDFHFTALGLSDEFACEYIMDILIDQTPNTNITYRHRHTMSSPDKIVPIFGKAAKADKVTLEHKGVERMFLRDEIVIPLKAPNGKDLDENIVYAEWVKKSYDEGKPVGISHHFQTRKENGKAFWANMLEIAGTPYPRCPECLNVPPQQTGEVLMNEEERKKLEQMDSKQLMKVLDETTLELERAQQVLEDKTKELGDLQSGSSTLQSKLETSEKELEKAKADGSKALHMFEELSKEFTALKLDLEFERTKGPLIREILALEGRPKLEKAYREDYSIEELEAHLAKLKQPKPDTSPMDPSFQMRRARQQLEGEEEPTQEEILKYLNPRLAADYKKLAEGRGG